MAQVVKLLGHGGQCFAESVLGWNRGTIRKGLIELESGIPIFDQYCHCGRKRAEEHLPNLLSDIKSIVDPSSQADPTFRSKRIYSPLTANEIHRRLQANQGYKSSDLPTVRTIRNKLNDLEIRPQRVKKCEPIRKIPETDAIFEKVSIVNSNTDKDPNAIRISLDCKAVVKIGPFSRGGKNRIEQKASDHDFEAEQTLVPFGVFIPELCESHFWFSIGPVTADFMVDRLQELWCKLHKRFPNLNKLVINADNGPENNGQRTQWLQRLVDFSDIAGIAIELAYYPPYHSKYNPVERLWGVLENHWRGELLTSTDKALGLARTMTYRTIAPSTVRLIKKIYRKGVRLTKKQMIPIEKRLQRLAGLEKWFITICPEAGFG
jgi:transposase